MASDSLIGEALGYTSLDVTFTLAQLANDFGITAAVAAVGAADGYDLYQVTGPTGGSRGAVLAEVTAIGADGTTGVSQIREWGTTAGSYYCFIVLRGAYP